jgi:hypothetical protein
MLGPPAGQTAEYMFGPPVRQTAEVKSCRLSGQRFVVHRLNRLIQAVILTSFSSSKSRVQSVVSNIP